MQSQARARLCLSLRACPWVTHTDVLNLPTRSENSLDSPTKGAGVGVHVVCDKVGELQSRWWCGWRLTQYAWVSGLLLSEEFELGVVQKPVCYLSYLPYRGGECPDGGGCAGHTVRIGQRLAGPVLTTTCWRFRELHDVKVLVSVQVAPDTRYASESGWPAGVRILNNEVFAPYGGILVGDGELASPDAAARPMNSTLGAAGGARPANATGVTDVVIEGNSIAGTGTFAVLITDADGVVVQRNRVQSSGSCGAGAVVGAGSYARALGPALYVDRASNVTFVGNSVVRGAACAAGAAGAALAAAGANTTGIRLLS